ncbi:hypothetical protein SKAU_G00257830 [Synaphobranchus kaupii]|uniref:Uncharacterized protein n=1 Tax=Synaphobranchus kaupii TaxID=118154 RepID=A0A9Q1F434_SYNKA|nr:hypothetical protein SKAU_G00257830 [Synaphobranchus kaupii]
MVFTLQKSPCPCPTPTPDVRSDDLITPCEAYRPQKAIGAALAPARPMDFSPIKAICVREPAGSVDRPAWKFQQRRDAMGEEP